MAVERADVREPLPSVVKILIAKFAVIVSSALAISRTCAGVFRLMM